MAPDTALAPWYFFSFWVGVSANRLIALSSLLLLQCLQVEFFSPGVAWAASGGLQGLVLAAGGRCGYLLEHLYLVACAKLPRHQVSRYLCPAKRHIEGRREAIRCLYQKL
ncbi:hypothetical protein J3E69DRAFT_319539, partial [Trichoderma sp. SZMC 28015]